MNRKKDEISKEETKEIKEKIRMNIRVLDPDKLKMVWRFTEILVGGWPYSDKVIRDKVLAKLERKKPKTKTVRKTSLNCQPAINK